MSKDDSTGKIQWDRLIKKLSPYTVQKGLRYLKHYGLKEFWIRLHERFEPEEVPYGPWYEAYRPDEETLEKQRKRKFPDGPLISIVVPAYLTPERFLRQMLDSLLCCTAVSDTGALSERDDRERTGADLHELGAVSGKRKPGGSGHADCAEILCRDGQEDPLSGSERESWHCRKYKRSFCHGRG